LAELASKKLAVVKDSRVKIRLGSRTVVLKDGVDQALTVVIAVEDFLSSAVSAEPHAAFAWAGMMSTGAKLRTPGPSERGFSAKTMELYCKILQYQARAICLRSRKALYQHGRDSLKADG
jgi:hypothetical protein